MASLNGPSDLQYLKDCNIQSNSKIIYKDITSNNYENRIKLDPENETKMDIRNYIPLNHLNQTIIKEYPEETNAFEKADIEADITKQISNHKYQVLLQKEKNINEIVSKKNKEIRDNFKKEKEDLKRELTQIIRDALTFSKKNNPMTSMLPNSITGMITKIKEDKGLNISVNSLNNSQMSKNSSRSVKKYESNAFLKALGIDLLNLSPDNIKIDIDQAYNFILNWKTDRNIREVIRYKVVNEIMSVEEKRASQRVEKLNKKIAVYKHKKKEEGMKLKKELEEAMKAEEDKQDPKLKVKMKMMNSVRGKTPKDFSDKNKQKKFGAKVELRKKTVSSDKMRRRRGKKEQEVKEPKIKIKLNSYNHVDKILQFIHQSDELSENPTICKHFLNIKYNKKMDDLTRKLMAKNRLESTIDSDPKY